MTVVYYSQEDIRWRYNLYTITGDRTQTIGTSACGPTCFAMVAATFRDKSIQPPETAKFAIDRGYRTANSGTAWSYFAAAAKHYGLICKQTSSLDEAKQALAAGALVIGSMGPGHMTGGGHYVLLVGISGKWIEVYDPNHDNTKYGSDGLIDQGVKNDGKIKADELVFKREARQYWIFPRPIKEEEPMTKEEKEAFDAMREDMAALKLALEANTRELAKERETISAPKWFISEFEKDKVLERISDPTGTLDFWRSLAVSLRMQGYGEGK